MKRETKLTEVHGCGARAFSCAISQEVLGSASAWASQACKTPNSVNENLGTSNAKDESAAPKLYLSL